MKIKTIKFKYMLIIVLAVIGTIGFVWFKINPLACAFYLLLISVPLLLKEIIAGVFSIINKAKADLDK